MQVPAKMLHIDPEVQAILGKTDDEIANMGLREFAELSYSKGIIWEVREDGGRVRGLTIEIRRENHGHAGTP